VADNLLAGIEFEMTKEAKEAGKCFIDGGLVIGKTDNTSGELDNASPRGIITPRGSDYFGVKNVSFFAFNWTGAYNKKAAAIGSCSHCWHGAATDSGARHVTFEGLTFEDATVPTRINYQVPWRAIYYDVDGTLTDKGPKGWAMPYWQHNHWEPDCERDPK
jgi:hypothetical protein